LSGTEERSSLVSTIIPSVNTHDQKGRLFLMVMQTRKKGYYFQSVEQYKNASQALCSDVSFY
jgi:hypothetical protein